jgi:anaerobic selenocysteine-containing dehydrogenase
VEKVATQKNSLSGEHFSGIPIYRGQRDAADRPLQRDGKYPLALITFKEAFGGHSRTISNYWGNIALQPENKIWIHKRDAERMGLRLDQEVRLVSASNPDSKVALGDGEALDLVARLHVREGIRPGTVAVSWHYGHWAYGSRDIAVDGHVIKADARRAAGVCPNPVMEVDPILQDVCLTDPIGASASFFDTYIDLIPV